MGVWDTTTPTGSDPISQGDDRIRELKAALAEALACGGIFPGPNPLTAPEFYPTIAKGAESSRPAASTDYPGRMYLNEDTESLDRIKDDGSAWEAIYRNPTHYAIHAAVPSSVATVSGVLTLPETGNAFTVTGTEAVTSIAGWSAGIVTIKWASARILTHSATLSIQGALSRNVCAGDVSTFMFTAADTVLEIGFFGALSGKEAGEVFAWAGATAPTGALECAGQSLLRADYPRLYAAIGTAHGYADGTHFNLPDLRGRFVRGYDHTAGNDPDAAGRTAAATNGQTGDNVGSLQADDYKAHSHTTAANSNAAVGGTTNVTDWTIQTGNTGTSPTSGGNETRPKNISMMYCIKY